LNDIDDKANHVFFENYEEARARKQAKADYDRCMALVGKEKEIKKN